MVPGDPEPARVSCDFSVSATLSPEIGAVGIVQWATSLSDVVSARVEFGLDGELTHRAPVDLELPDHRTLLLGMKEGRDYQFRIVADTAGTRCTSELYEIRTEAAPNALPRPEVETLDRSRLAPGFLVTTLFTNGHACILDEDGDYVWWYRVAHQLTSARMSHDGHSIWLSTVNVPEGQSQVYRVSMDGLMREDLSDSFAGQNHQLTVLPDESVAFYAYDESGCDDIKEYTPDGRVRTLVNARVAHAGRGNCHLNAIEYSAVDDTLIFSDLAHNNLTKIRRDGSTVWVLGGDTSHFEDSGAEWINQHGLQPLGLSRLLLFSNGAIGAAASRALEIELDQGSMTARSIWQYTANPPIANHILGDVQRLENGNTLVVYSTQGVVHEVDRDNQLAQTLRWELGGALGYGMKRPSLYGPPPK